MYLYGSELRLRVVLTSSQPAEVFLCMLLSAEGEESSWGGGHERQQDKHQHSRHGPSHCQPAPRDYQTCRSCNTTVISSWWVIKTPIMWLMTQHWTRVPESCTTSVFSSLDLISHQCHPVDHPFIASEQNNDWTSITVSYREHRVWGSQTQLWSEGRSQEHLWPSYGRSLRCRPVKWT